MSSLVLEIEDVELVAGQRAYIDRVATYFLLMVGSDVDVEWYSKGNRIGGAVGLQGGDAVGPLSQAYDRVVMTSATAQTVKVATSSDPVTITRLSGVVNINGVVRVSDDYQAVNEASIVFAQFFTTRVAAEYSVGVLKNKGTKNLIIRQIALNKPQAGYAYVFYEADADAIIPDGVKPTGTYSHLLGEPTPDYDRQATVASLAGISRPSEDSIVGAYSGDTNTIQPLERYYPMALKPGESLMAYCDTVDTTLNLGVLFEVQS